MCLETTPIAFHNGQEDGTQVFEFITQCAILVMPTLLVFQMHPIRDYHRLTEWGLFMLIEHLSARGSGEVLGGKVDYAVTAIRPFS